MIKTLRYIILGTVLVMAGASCSDNDEYDNPSRPVEPGDSYFSSEPVKEGPSLFDAANINIDKIPRIKSNKNTDLDEYYPIDSGNIWTSVIRPERVKFFENFLKEDMIFVNGGTFLMGATAEQGEGVHIDELPVHKVTVSDFYICRFEVTQEMYSYVMGVWEKFSWEDLATTRLPMDNRLFSEMQTFCNKLNEITGLHFTLPTEAQWEFAARGGRKRTSTVYAGSNNFDEVGYNFSNCYRLPEGQTGMQFWPEEVGKKLPNELGLYDMSGNVAEVCLDWYDEYSDEDQVDPAGSDALSSDVPQRRICRGGGWNTNTSACRVSARAAFPVDKRNKLIGFRLVHPKLENVQYIN